MRTSHKLGQLNAGQVLIAEGLISGEQLREMLEEQKGTGERITDIAIARGLVTEHDIAKAMALHLQIPFIHPKACDIPDGLVANDHATFLRHNRMIPLDRIKDILVVASCGDVAPKIIDELETYGGCKVALYIAQIGEIQEVLDLKYPKENVGQEVASALDALFGGE